MFAFVVVCLGVASIEHLSVDSTQQSNFIPLFLAKPSTVELLVSSQSSDLDKSNNRETIIDSILFDPS